MYAGQIVESANIDRLFGRACHPYTKGLLNAVPKLTGSTDRLFAIKGSVPEPTQMPDGCRFCVHDVSLQPSNAGVKCLN